LSSRGRDRAGAPRPRPPAADHARAAKSCPCRRSRQNLMLPPRSDVRYLSPRPAIRGARWMSITRLREFVGAMTRLVEHEGNAEGAAMAPARALLEELVMHDDWLPEPFAASDPQRYRQYLLYGDPLDRFTLVSF